MGHGKRWADDEDDQLCRSIIAVSEVETEDLLRGPTYWGNVMSHLASLAPGGKTDRTACAVENRWKVLSAPAVWLRESCVDSVPTTTCCICHELLFDGKKAEDGPKLLNVHRMQKAHKIATAAFLLEQKASMGSSKKREASDDEEGDDCGSAKRPRTENITQLQKRTDYLSWDDYFMSVAFLSAMRSKDPSTQVGACIVNAEKKIVGIGYNGFPNGCDDDALPWARQGASPLETKYPYVCHAEMNAILNKNSSSVHNCTIYVALFPCNECAKLIIQSGIKSVIYYSDKYKDDWKFEASRRLLDLAKVTYRQHEMSTTSLTIDFTSIR
ncbi:deoxycytidylate deaminase [Achlya hypogyna]|uniref:dCMP deaminase n=1 Tax=Achlya hypogyna TaxID=1202772 RepID=A0A1V9Y8R4_ACHHY|nr:deoxycytidylate deaminase [Achlya hypogyna]